MKVRVFYFNWGKAYSQGRQLQPSIFVKGDRQPCGVFANTASHCPSTITQRFQNSWVVGRFKAKKSPAKSLTPLCWPLCETHKPLRVPQWEHALINPYPPIHSHSPEPSLMESKSELQCRKPVCHYGTEIKWITESFEEHHHNGKNSRSLASNLP